MLIDVVTALFILIKDITAIVLIQREGKNNYFSWLLGIIRGNKLPVFQQCESSLIIRVKLINCIKLKELFFEKFHFEKKIVTILKLVTK